MDDLQRREKIMAMKAKADAELEKRRAHERYLRFRAKEELNAKWSQKINDAHMDVLLNDLSDPKAPIKFSHKLTNRPGEKLGRNRTRGMRMPKGKGMEP